MQALREIIPARVESIDSVEKVRPLLGGACQENFMLEVRMVDGSSGKLVLRSDSETSLPGSLNRSQEFEVIGAAREAGVETPQARWLTPNLLREGADAYFLDWVEGIALGGKVVRDPALETARAELPARLAANLARLHSIAPPGELRSLDPPPADPVEWALNLQRATLDELPQPRPGLELIYRWLKENRPTSRPVTLVHGDFRVGNFMVTPEGLQAVLDWEFAHWGDPVEDLAWLCVRDWRFGKVTQPAGGLCDRRELCRAYEAAGGRPVDEKVLHYWEVFGNLRWGSGAVAQGLRFAQEGEPKLELMAIARRVAEMEFEALRRIEESL